MSPRARAAAGLAAVVAAQVAALTVLLALGDDPAWRVDLADPVGWARRADLETLVGATARLGALLTITWLLVGTLVHLGAGLCRLRPPRLAPAPLRHLVDRTLAVGLLATGVVPAVARPVAAGPPPVATGSPPPATLLVEEGPDGLPRLVAPPTPDASLHPPQTDPGGPDADGSARSPAVADEPPEHGAETPGDPVVRAPAGPGGPASPVTGAAVPGPPGARTPGDADAPDPVVRAPGERPPAATRSPESAPQRSEHVIRPGESLWSVARDALGTDDPTRVGPYWARLVGLNRDRLRSGDPDLVYPGEVVVLPPRDASPPL